MTGPDPRQNPPSPPGDRTPGPNGLKGTLRPASFDLPQGVIRPANRPSGRGTAGSQMPLPGVQEDPNSPAAPGGRRRRSLWIVPVVGALVAGGLAFMIAKAVVGDNETAGAVELVAADEVGTSPFVEAKADVSDDEIRVARDAGSTTRPSGPESSPSTNATSDLEVTAIALGPTAGAVYASREKPVCDVAAISTALQRDDDARAAWAELMGVSPDDVTATLSKLTPLVLTRDTAVTNSRYAKGQPSTFPAILQAGTPVLVDEAGMPRVKCSCGNPLTPAKIERGADLEGARWEGFDPGEVVSVTQGVVPDGGVATIDLATGEPTTVTLDETLSPDEREVAPEPGCEVRLLYFYDPESDNLAGELPWDEVPGSGVFHRSTVPNVSVRLRQADGRLRDGSLAELSTSLAASNGERFILCGHGGVVSRIVQAPPVRPIPDDATMTIEGVGDAHVGVTVGEVEVAVRRPLQVRYQNEEFDGACQQLTFGQDNRLVFLATDGVIGRVEVADGSNVRTDRGIGIGSTEAEVLRAYDGEITSERHPYDEDGRYLTYKPKQPGNRQMIFETADGRVITFRVGDDKTTPWIEGCL